MSWSDDDWDPDEAVAEPKKEAEEEEMTIDDIEEAERKKKQAELAALPKTKKKEKKEKEEVAPEDVPYDVALNDPAAEKARRQKLVEEADARMAADLFSGVTRSPEEIARLEAEAAEKKRKEEEEAAAKKAAKKEAKTEVRDAFEQMKLATQTDVETLLQRCMEKIESGKAKNAGPLFLTHLTKALADSLETEELNNFDKLLAGIVKEKKVEKAANQAKASKTNDKLNKNTKFDTNAAMSEMYGGAGEWDDWDDEEWWDEGTAADYAPPKR